MLVHDVPKVNGVMLSVIAYRCQVSCPNVTHWKLTASFLPRGPYIIVDIYLFVQILVPLLRLVLYIVLHIKNISLITLTQYWYTENRMITIRICLQTLSPIIMLNLCVFLTTPWCRIDNCFQRSCEFTRWRAVSQHRAVDSYNI